MCCSVFQCVAMNTRRRVSAAFFFETRSAGVSLYLWQQVYCSVLDVLGCVGVCDSTLQYVAVCCRVLECVAVCCSEQALAWKCGIE